MENSRNLRTLWLSRSEEGQTTLLIVEDCKDEVAVIIKLIGHFQKDF